MAGKLPATFLTTLALLAAATPLSGASEVGTAAAVSSSPSSSESSLEDDPERPTDAIKESIVGFTELSDSGVVRVRIPKRVCDPRKHGAKADGKADDTSAIQAAIDSCAKAGGGTVPFACGGSNCTFFSFPLHLTGNHTELRLDAGATLKFSDARNDSRWHGIGAALLGENLTDVAVTGGGTIDGSGELWWMQCAGHSLHASGWSTCGRPGLFTLAPVSNVLITGVTFLNSPCHHIVIRESRDVEIGHVKVLAPPSYDQMGQSNNTDGIDIDGVNYYLHDSEISVGDDLIVVGSNNSLVERMRFGAGRGASIAPGCEGDGEKKMRRAHITNITIRDSTFTRTNRGVRVKTRANSSTADGGHNEHHPGCIGSATNIKFQNLRMVDVNSTISMIMHYPCADTSSGGGVCWPLFNSTSMKLDITIENLTATGSGWAAAIDAPSYAIGDKDAVLNLRMKNVHIESKHGFESWGRLDCSAQNVVPMPDACPTPYPRPVPIGCTKVGEKCTSPYPGTPWQHPKIHQSPDCLHLPGWHDIAAALTLNGEHHIFQGCPVSQGWSHSVSRDLVHWEDRGRGLHGINESYEGMNSTAASYNSPCSGFMTVDDAGTPCAGFRQCTSTQGVVFINPEAKIWDVPMELRCATNSNMTKWSEPIWIHDIYYNRWLPYDPPRPWKDTDGKWYSSISTDGCNGTNQWGPTPAANLRKLPCKPGGQLELLVSDGDITSQNWKQLPPLFTTK